MISPRLAIAATVLTVAVAVPSVVAATETASATVKTSTVKPAAATKYANCTTLHKTYKYGVMKPGTKYNVIHHSGKPNTNQKITGTPKSDLSLYNTNSKLDADKDGIACELG